MPSFTIIFAGRESECTTIECADLSAARNQAIQQLGRYLADHPHYAEEGHWRVTIEDEMGRAAAAVIVATVTPRHGPLPG
ncbi:hypothetical protein QP166_15755 [Sphingomonas sp. LR60]|uniref:DUF6894 family protein n=1 Tax=Sphingomonas sp. LR60 TaxID=3050233 RepID=UPI002FE2778D